MTKLGSGDSAGKALSSGCDAWLIASPDVSAWARRLDWYLNFQIMKAVDRRPRPLAEALLSIVAKTDFELPLPTLVTENLPLLIASSSLLPVAKTVVVPSQANVKTWAESCFVICRKIFSTAQSDTSKRRVRIFLPEKFRADGFRAAWSAAGDAPASIEIVEEHE